MFANTCAPQKSLEFMDLPQEIRDQIYEHALFVGQPIRPHLCATSATGAIKFHDDQSHSRTQPNHDGISKFLGITLVSKKIRAESLPCFYSANTFIIGADTATYLTHLEHLGRTDVLKHIAYSVPMRPESGAAMTLHQMSKYLDKVHAYESSHQPLPLDDPANDRANHEYLTKHPQYHTAGLRDLALFACLRKLSSWSASGHDGCARDLFIPLEGAATIGGVFSENKTLRWFPLVAHGLGIKLRSFKSKTGPVITPGVGSVWLVWRKKHHKEKTSGEGVDAAEGEMVRKKMSTMSLDLTSMNSSPTGVYYRRSCGGNAVEWFDVLH